MEHDMLRLTLIRHAKSSWKDTTLKDFERPLNKRGRHNAPLMGKVIRQSGLSFDRMVSSPAERAITTARLVAAQLGYPEQQINAVDELYDASARQLLHAVQKLDDSWHSVALVAHNPGLTQLCNDLSDAGIDNLPTCAVAVIEFELDTWRAVHPKLGRLTGFEYPRKYSD
jgi:phosphohistidine phosphatase